MWTTLIISFVPTTVSALLHWSIDIIVCFCFILLLYKSMCGTCRGTSFSSAPPPASEISTLWEIIVRASSASELPRPRQLFGGFSRLHLSLLPLSGAFGLPSYGVMASFLVAVLSSFKHACVDIPTPYPALRDVPRLVFCTVCHPFFLVNTRSPASAYR